MCFSEGFTPFLSVFEYNMQSEKLSGPNLKGSNG
jgi:hypothetical protein